MINLRSVYSVSSVIVCGFAFRKLISLQDSARWLDSTIAKLGIGRVSKGGQSCFGSINTTDGLE
jgi:hypothetical protein